MNSALNKSGLDPAGHRIIVKVDKVEEETAGSIIIAKSLVDKEQNAQTRGVVVAIGAGCWLDTTVDQWCEVGDRIVFGKFAGLYWKGLKDEAEYRLLNDVDVVAVFNEKEPAHV